MEALNSRSLRAREQGPQLVLILKIIFIISFLILALADRNVKWFRSVNPTERDRPASASNGPVALGEAPLAGLGAALSFVAVALWRKKSGLTLPAPKIPPEFPGWKFWKAAPEGTKPSLDILKLGIVSFIVFTILQVFFELAGFNELPSEEGTTGSKKFNKTAKTLMGKKFVYVVMFVVMLLVFSFAICAWDSPPVGWGRFIAEGLIVGAGSAIPAYIVTRNRGGSQGEQITNFGAGMVLFGLLAHPFLQYSGMYREFGFMPGH
jgi:hypothetical protein